MGSCCCKKYYIDEKIEKNKRVFGGRIIEKEKQRERKEGEKEEKIYIKRKENKDERKEGEEEIGWEIRRKESIHIYNRKIVSFESKSSEQYERKEGEGINEFEEKIRLKRRKDISIAIIEREIYGS